MKISRPNDNSKFYPMLAGTLVFIFVGFYAFVLSYDSSLPACSALLYLLEAAAAAKITILCFEPFASFLENIYLPKMRTLLTGSNLLTFLFLTGISLEIHTSGTSVVGDRTWETFVFSLEKKWLYDILVIVLFPGLCIFIKKILENKFSRKNCLAAFTVIATVNVSGALFFDRLPDIYLIEMALLNIITVSTLIFTLKYKNMQRISRITICSGYTFGWLVFLTIFTDFGNSFHPYLYNRGQWGNLLDNPKNPICFLLHNYSWIGVMIYTILLVLFLLLMYKFLGHKYREYKTCYLIYQAAFANLLIRSIAGLLYRFSITALPVAMPFHGTVGLIMDSVGFGLLLYSELKENRNIRTCLKIAETMSGLFGNKSNETLKANVEKGE